MNVPFYIHTSGNQDITSHHITSPTARTARCPAPNHPQDPHDPISIVISLSILRSCKTQQTKETTPRESILRKCHKPTMISQFCLNYSILPRSHLFCLSDDQGNHPATKNPKKFTRSSLHVSRRQDRFAHLFTRQTCNSIAYSKFPSIILTVVPVQAFLNALE